MKTVGSRELPAFLSRSCLESWLFQIGDSALSACSPASIRRILGAGLTLGPAVGILLDGASWVLPHLSSSSAIAMLINIGLGWMTATLAALIFVLSLTPIATGTARSLRRRWRLARLLRTREYRRYRYEKPIVEPLPASPLAEALPPVHAVQSPAVYR